jgi:signal transduction histidine kinase
MAATMNPSLRERNTHAEVGADGMLLGEVTRAIEYASQLSVQLARTARGERRLSLERQDLASVARSTVRSINRLPRFLGRRFDLDIPPVAMGIVDVVLFEQLLTNLVMNAGDEGPTVRVTPRLDPDHLRLGVSDDGPGIPVERTRDVFSAFETTKPDGLGLGLLSVRVAVELHGGTILLEPSPLGGAAFIVRLPREIQISRARASAAEGDQKRGKAGITPPPSPLLEAPSETSLGQIARSPTEAAR